MKEKELFRIISKVTMYSMGSPIEFDSEETETLLNEYMNDKNSSTIRELITLYISNVYPLEGKLNYDGYDNYGNFYEVKPINIVVNGNETVKKKLDGSGYYTDLTWARHRKYMLENPKILVSGFVNGRICYVFEFPYHILCQDVEKALMKHLGECDAANRYMRKYKFTYRNWMHCCITKYITDNNEILSPRYFVKDFLENIFEKKINAAKETKNKCIFPDIGVPEPLVV